MGFCCWADAKPLAYSNWMAKWKITLLNSRQYVQLWKRMCIAGEIDSVSPATFLFWMTPWEFGLPFLFLVGRRHGTFRNHCALKVRFVNHVFDEWVVDSQTEDAVWVDNIIQMHNFCDTSPSSVELHCTYLGISGCHAIVAHKTSVAEQYIQVSDTLVTMMCGWSCLPHPVLLLSVSSWTSLVESSSGKLGWGWLALIRMPGNEV